MYKRGNAMIRKIKYTVLLLLISSIVNANTYSNVNNGANQTLLGIGGVGEGWELVAHMSNTGGMFDGDGDLRPDYSFGVFDSDPTASTADFQREFPFFAGEILFMTGDLSIWGITDYTSLRNIIDARGGDLNPNLAFEIGINGVVSNTVGNVLSRVGKTEDPWVSIQGSHSDGVTNELIAWGESNHSSGTHKFLKNNHGGLNVFIRAGVPPVAEIYTVTNTTDAGVGSLRQAIIDANANANTNIGADRIHFNIVDSDCDAAGVCHINVLTELPTISDAVIIDGTTQPRYGTAPANVCATQSSASYMRIELNASDHINFIKINSTQPSTVKGLSIGNEINLTSYAITLGENAKQWVNCNHLGVNAEGTEKLFITNGICISCASIFGDNGVIGTNSDGIDDIAERNVIGGVAYGVYINFGNNYTIAGNYFGLSADGLSPLSSSSSSCVYIRQTALNNRVGSNLDGFNDSVEKNIFANCNTAVYLEVNAGSPLNRVTGNWFGVNANGDTVAGMFTGIRLDGSVPSSEPQYLVAANWINSASGAGSAIRIQNNAQLQTGSINNCITNSVIGLRHDGTALNQPFINNYWGDASGPSGIGFGSGASLVESSSGTVEYNPWNTEMVGDCLNYESSVTKKYAILLSITGLEASNSVSFANGSDTITIDANGVSNLSILDDLSAFDVSITTQPNTPTQLCIFTNNNSGNLSGAHVIIDVECVDQYLVGGSVSGMDSGSQVILNLNQGDELLTVTDNQAFVFFKLFDDEDNYSVAIQSHPSSGQTCIVTDGIGVISGADIENVSVTCDIIFRDGFDD